MIRLNELTRQWQRSVNFPRGRIAQMLERLISSTRLPRGQIPAGVLWEFEDRTTLQLLLQMILTQAIVGSVVSTEFNFWGHVPTLLAIWHHWLKTEVDHLNIRIVALLLNYARSLLRYYESMCLEKNNKNYRAIPKGQH